MSKHDPARLAELDQSVAACEEALDCLVGLFRVNAEDVDEATNMVMLYAALTHDADPRTTASVLVTAIRRIVRAEDALEASRG